MFNEAQKQSYKEIKAPESLKERVLASAKTEEKAKARFSPVLVRRIAVIAACLVCVFTVSAVAIANRSDVKFYSDGQRVTEKVVFDVGGLVTSSSFSSRSIPGVSVKIFVETNKDCRLYVNGGYVENEGNTAENPGEELTLTADAYVLWTVDNPFQDSYTLTAQSGSKAFTLVLSFDNETGTWQLHEEK